MMLALRPPGRGGLEPGHLNALRMELERSPESRWRGAASRTLLPGEPSAGPSLRTFVSRSDLWPPHPGDPRALPSDSSEVRFCFLTRGLQACGLGPAPDSRALRAQTLTRLPLRARFQFPSLEVAETLFAFWSVTTKAGPRFSLASVGLHTVCNTCGCRWGLYHSCLVSRERWTQVMAAWSSRVYWG